MRPAWTSTPGMKGSAPIINSRDAITTAGTHDPPAPRGLAANLARAARAGGSRSVPSATTRSATNVISNFSEV